MVAQNSLGPADRGGGRPMYGGHVWTPEAGYDIAAAVYDQWHWTEFWRRNERQHVVELVRRQQPIRRSIDIGCGTGAYYSTLAEFGPVVGIDPSRRMLARARLRTNDRLGFVRGTATDVPLPKQSADVCLSARSLCHEADLTSAVREIGRVVEAGGVWLITELHPEHCYPRTRIPFNDEDVHIETFKRSPDDIVRAAAESNLWVGESVRALCWRDLIWQPRDSVFDALDRTGMRMIFFVVALRRR
jgi:SAM-dependent methyltransferase